MITLDDFTNNYNTKSEVSQACHVLQVAKKFGFCHLHDEGLQLQFIFRKLMIISQHCFSQ
jgi:hypothetical protein